MIHRGATEDAENSRPTLRALSVSAMINGCLGMVIHRGGTEDTENYGIPSARSAALR